jgi:hypothetical protein
MMADRTCTSLVAKPSGSEVILSRTAERTAVILSERVDEEGVLGVHRWHAADTVSEGLGETDAFLSTRVTTSPDSPEVEIVNAKTVLVGRDFRFNTPKFFNAIRTVIIPWAPFSVFQGVRFFDQDRMERLIESKSRNLTWLRGGSYLILAESNYGHIYHDATSFSPLWDARTSGNVDRWYPPMDNLFLNRPAPQTPWMREIFEIILDGDAGSNNVTLPSSEKWDSARRLDGDMLVYSRSYDMTKLILPDGSNRVSGGDKQYYMF